MNISKADLVGLTGVDLARFWAKRGARVLPVAPAPAKRPLIGAWQDKATDDLQTIEAWWRQYPEARVGIATGDPGFDVADFDVTEGKPGLEQMGKLIDLGIVLPRTFYYVATPSGGRHLYFVGSQQRNKQNEKSIPGVDFRGQGGMILAAGNPGYDLIAVPGDGLVVVDWGAIRDALAPPTPPEAPRASPSIPPPPTPASAPQAVPGAPGRRRGLVAPRMGFDDPVGEESPLDWYTRNHDMGELLNRHGWRFSHESGGRLHWMRPGKERAEGPSGNVATMPDGRVVFYNFSSSVDLPVNTAMSTAQLYAHLEHGGNFGEAARQIRRGMMPQRAQATTTAPAAPPATVRPLSGTPVGVAPVATTESTGDGEPGSALVPIEDVFWSERPELRNIRWLARERRVSPWSVLGSVLALVSCRIGPHVVLPPIVGGVASLNLLVGLVGPSGKGKGASWSVGLEYLDAEGLFPIEEISTPEGIDASFTETPAKSGPIQYNDVAFFYVPEVDRLRTQAENTAMLSHLRKVWSGELLGGKTAAKERWRPVRAHAYRASVAIGIQPRRSGAILNDADGGLPQRFLWMPVHDPTALRRKDKLKPPAYAGVPPQVDFDVWVPEGEQRGEKNEPVQVEVKNRWVIPVCRNAQNEIIDAREENLVSEHGGMDSHALLTQLKTAALLAFLDRRAEVTDDDWRLARVIMKISDQTRAWCTREMRVAEDEENAQKGRGRAVQAVHEELNRTVVRDEHAEKVEYYGNKLLSILQAHPGREYSPRELRIQMGDAATTKQWYGDVEKSLLATPGIVQGPEVVKGGRRIRKISWTASDEPA